MTFKPLTDMSVYSKEELNENEDHGYYFALLTYDIKLVRRLLEENGFIETKADNFVVCWGHGTFNTKVFQYLSPYQKVIIKYLNKT